MVCLGCGFIPFIDSEIRGGPKRDGVWRSGGRLISEVPT